MKKCAICKDIKSLNSFCKNKFRKDGLHTDCNNCKKTYRIKNRKNINLQKRAYNKIERVKEYRRNYHREYQRKRRKETLYKLGDRLRSRISVLRGRNHSSSALSDLGCPLQQLKIYIVSKFYNHLETNEPMTWENWGRGYGKWQIDHIKELHNYDLSDKEQFLEVVHYTNLQPLWYCDHIQKSYGTRTCTIAYK